MFVCFFYVCFMSSLTFFSAFVCLLRLSRTAFPLIQHSLYFSSHKGTNQLQFEVNWLDLDIHCRHPGKSKVSTRPVKKFNRADLPGYIICSLSFCLLHKWVLPCLLLFYTILDPPPPLHKSIICCRLLSDTVAGWLLYIIFIDIFSCLFIEIILLLWNLYLTSLPPPKPPHPPLLHWCFPEGHPPPQRGPLRGMLESRRAGVEIWCHLAILKVVA